MTDAFNLPRAGALNPGSGAAVISFWAAVGLVLFLAEIWVWASWVSGPNFVPTLPGPDPLPAFNRYLYIVIQAIFCLAMPVCAWYWIIRPWRRESRLTTDGMLAICMTMIVFFDPCMNYTSTTLLYNAHFVNFGSWTLGSWPGWTSPGGNLLPEPILVAIPGYLFAVFGQCVLVCWALRKYQAGRPVMRVPVVIGIIVLSLFVVDSVIEIILVRSGIYAYPGGIREVTLFAGSVYQFPLTEGFFFGGLGVGATAVLMYFKDDKGRSFVEKGVERLRYGPVARQWYRFLALFGFTHLAFVLLYMVPCQWLATHSDPFPENYPSYMINGMCLYGAGGDECPGPGVLMPRPENNPF